MTSRRRVLKDLGTTIPVLTLSGANLAAAQSAINCSTPPIPEDAVIFPVDPVTGKPVEDWSAAYIDENGEYAFMTDQFVMGTASSSCVASIIGMDI